MTHSIAEALRRLGLTNQLLGFSFGGKSGDYRERRRGRCYTKKCGFRTENTHIDSCPACGYALKWG